jgi:methylated-DNA-[protein]-cysteine S-methyltransferase
MRRHRVVPSPLGPILLTVDLAGRLTALRIGGVPDESAPEPTDTDDHARATARRGLDHAATQLHEYFEGRRRSFDVELALEGTPFQRRVWAHLQTIPFGSTVSYGQLAAQLDRAGAARAVGHAVPCHRVIGSTGQLTGYGGGLEAKHALLDLEARAVSSGPVVAPA